MRAYLLLTSPPALFPSTDNTWYDAVARSIEDGHLGRLPAVGGGRVLSIRFPPAYPSVLAVGRSLLFWVNSFDAHLWTGAALGALATGAVAALTWRLGRRAPLRVARACHDRRGTPVRAESGRGRCVGFAHVRGPGAPDRRVRPARHRPVGHRRRAPMGSRRCSARCSQSVRSLVPRRSSCSRPPSSVATPSRAHVAPRRHTVGGGARHRLRGGDRVVLPSPRSSRSARS